MQSPSDLNKDKLQKINAINSMMIAVENLLHGIDNLECAFAKKTIQEVKWWSGLAFAKHTVEVPNIPTATHSVPVMPTPSVAPSTPMPVDNNPPPPPTAA